MTASLIKGLTSLGRTQPSVAVIFIHYNQYGHISRGFRILIDSSLRCGYCTMLVSTSSNLYSYEDIVDKGATVIIRENTGRDFGSLFEARDILCETIAKVNIKRIVVCNSSMMNIGSDGFGADPVLDHLVNASEDLAGITESYERSNYHIQSYHYSLSGRFFFSRYFNDFASSYRNTAEKAKQARDHAILHGEITLTRIALENKMTTSTLFPINRLLTIANLQKLVRIQMHIRSSLLEPATMPIGSSPLDVWLKDILADAIPSDYGFNGYNPVQACWLILILSGYLFFKREIIEIREEECTRCKSPHFLLYPILESAGIDLTTAYDINDLRYSFTFHS